MWISLYVSESGVFLLSLCPNRTPAKILYPECKLFLSIDCYHLSCIRLQRVVIKTFSHTCAKKNVLGTNIGHIIVLSASVHQFCL